MLKKILGLTIASLLILTLTVGGTWAYLSDSGKSSANKISARTLSLQLANPSSAFSSGITRSFNISKLKPTQSTPAVQIDMINPSGNVSGHSMDYSFSYSSSDNSPNADDISADTLASILQVTVLDYDRTVWFLSEGYISDWNGNGYIDLEDLKIGTNAPNNEMHMVRTIDPGIAHNFEIQLQMRNTDQYGNLLDNINDFQNDGLDITMTFTLNQ